MDEFVNVPMTSSNAAFSPKDTGYSAEPMKVYPTCADVSSKLRPNAPVFLPMFQEAKLEEVECFSPSNDPGSPSSVMSRSGTRVHFPPGLAPPDDTPSHGSSLHSSGNCKPCAWYWKPGSCQNGKECLHCHLCSKDELKSRKKAKSAFMRLGLTSPKQERTPLALSKFCLTEHVDLETSEQGSTVAATSESEHTPRKPSSQGSALHGTGECRPCAWFWKPSGCQNGAECRHCHDCPVGEVKSRKKGKMAMLRLGLATPKASTEAYFEPM